MKFDLILTVRGHELRLVGEASPYIPATGPTMEHAGGDPAEGGEIEIEKALMVRLPHETRRVRRYHERLLCSDMTDVIGNDSNVLSSVAEELGRLEREYGY